MLDCRISNKRASISRILHGGLDTLSPPWYNSVIGRTYCPTFLINLGARIMKKFLTELEILLAVDGMFPIAHGAENCGANADVDVDGSEKPAGIVVRPDTENYTKSKSANGSSTLHNGDVVATGLASLLLDETYSVASKLLDVAVATLEQKYENLNLGMQRMNLGNRIRGAVAQISKGNAKDIAKIEKANAKVISLHAKAVEKHQKDHAIEIAKIDKANSVEGADKKIYPTSILPAIPTLSKVPELVEGAGEKAFNEAIAEFKDAIGKRSVEAELAEKTKSEKAEKIKAELVIKAEAKAKAKAELIKTKSEKAEEIAEKAEKAGGQTSAKALDKTLDKAKTGKADA